MPAKKTIYDLTGDQPRQIERYAIVADELVATDPKHFSFELPAKAAPAAKAKGAEKGE